MKFIRFFLLLILLNVGTLLTQSIEIPLNYEETCSGRDSFVPYYRIHNPRITLALSGGGARGLAQIGVLKVLERHSIPIDGIAGTSMGAIIGGLYAIGYSANDLDSMARNISWNEIIHDTPPRQQLFLAEKTERFRHLIQLRFEGFSINIQNAYTSGLKFNELLSELIWKAPYPVSRNFNELLIPFQAVSTDLLTGKKIVISDGSLIEAIRSSMTIPLLFSPIKKESAWLVDGGLVQNLPVEEAQQMNGDIVIAVDTSSKLRSANHLKAPWEIADQVTTIMAQESIQHQYELADVGIQPQLDEISNMDFLRIDDMIRAGELAAEKAIPMIDSLLAQLQPDTAEIDYIIHKINISGCHYTPSDAYLCDELDISHPVDLRRIQWAARKLYESGRFTHIRSFFDMTNHELTFEVQETPFIKKIEIHGNTVFSDSLLLSIMDTHPGDIIKLHKGKQDIRRLLTLYHKSGYTLVRLRAIYIQDQVLHLQIDEGRIQDIQIQGHRVTLPFVIQRELVMAPGELFNITQVNQSVQNIYSTGYFQEVRFEVLPYNDNYHLIFNVTEHHYSLSRLGMRYDLERLTKGFLEIVQDNIFGIGAEGSFTGLLGSKDISFRLGLRADRLYTSYLTSKLEIGFDRSRYSYYQNYNLMGDYFLSQLYSIVGVGRQMQRLGTVSLEIRSEGYRFNPGPNLPIASDQKFIQTICIRSEVDTRDQMPFPYRGKYHQLEYETSLRVLGSDVNFNRLCSWMETYYPLRKNLIIHPKLFWGTADLSTPFPKTYYLGGLNSFMGLQEKALIGKRCLLFSNEIRHRFRWVRNVETYISFRYDFGGVWGKYSRINLKDFKHGIGIILSINTPLGPFQFAAGKMNEGKSQLYLSMGHLF